MRMLFGLVMSFCLVILMCGCSTIVSGKTETIRFTSEPAGQYVTVDGQSFTMPAKVPLSRKTTHIATFPNGETVLIDRGFNVWFLGNIAIGGLIGMAIDLATNSVMNDLSPNSVLYKDGQVYPGGHVPTAKKTPDQKSKIPGMSP